MPGDEDKLTENRPLEVLICVGSPGSGKSTFVLNYLGKYTRINNDDYKTKANCMKKCKEELEAGRSCVIDNTNKGVDERAGYIKIAQSFNAKVRCLHFATDKETSIHNNF
jgi:bifunctional polynucleotide phosphatase/kinase